MNPIPPISNKQIKEKNSEVFKKMKDYIINELDLDNYNITSDDFRDEQNKGKKSAQVVKVKANDTKGHPKVPKLDLSDVLKARDLVNQLNGAEDETEYEWEIDDEKGVQESSRKFMIDGSNAVTTEGRRKELEDRKKYIIHIFNQAYSESSKNSKDSI